MILNTDYVFTETLGYEMPIASMDIPYSDNIENLNDFIIIFKPKDINGLLTNENTGTM